ncbi:exported protein of unknown function [Xenorhabdus doucetiae]|uniref:Uncharacterized protein n=1 Tax=Xenorhabdus doucetiae TaxID=351671 RepID=A0A068R0J6_9GAMM|nr:exported protein of unknown function [Xenorhabdus doucetiae]
MVFSAALALIAQAVTTVMIAFLVAVAAVMAAALRVIGDLFLVYIKDNTRR